MSHTVLRTPTFQTRSDTCHVFMTVNYDTGRKLKYTTRYELCMKLPGKCNIFSTV